MTNAQSIVNVQTDYFNTPIIEIQPNQGFTDRNYQSDMELVGWVSGDEWCAFSAILAAKEGYINNGHPEIWDYFSKLASGNSQEMLRNCHDDAFWPTGLDPEIGGIVIWEAGDSATQGHTGLCIGKTDTTFTTFEGNSIPPGNPGNEREGYTIAMHVHTIGQPHSTLGLNYLRTIYAVESLPLK